MDELVTHLIPDDQPANAIHFSSIEEIQAATAAAGWMAQCRQLQAGRLSIMACSRQCGDISLLDVFASLRFEIAGFTPADCVTVLAAVEGTQFWVNGLTSEHENLVVLNPETEMHFISRENSRVLSMHLPDTMLQDVARVSGSDGVRGYQGSTMLRPGAEKTSALRQLMLKTIHQNVSDGWHARYTGHLQNRMARIWENHDVREHAKARLSAAESHRVVNCAREYIEDNLHDDIIMIRLCAHCLVSISKLERTFRRELGLSPSQYIQSRRLAAVNHRLKYAHRNDSKVADIAMDCGFTHLGRFAGAYRAHFGELPSETLLSA
jgi:AraC-like DNA-binding protein